MTHLAAYFKNPAGVDEHTFVRQLALLEAYAAGHGAAGHAAPGPRSAGATRAKSPGR